MNVLLKDIISCTLVAGDEAIDDAMFKFEAAEKKEACKFEKLTEKSNNVGSEDMRKVLIGLVGAVKEVMFVLCVIFRVVFLNQFS